MTARRFRTAIPLALLAACLTAEPSEAQSPDQLQLCNIVISARATFRAMGAAIRSESNPIVKQEIQGRARAEGGAAQRELESFARSRPTLESFSGVITHLGAANLGGAGAMMVVALDCPARPPDVNIAFEMSFNSPPDRHNWADIGPFLSVLRTLKKGDRIVFSGKWGHYTKYGFGDNSNPALFILIATNLAKS